MHYRKKLLWSHKCSEDSKLCDLCEEGFLLDKIGGCAYVPNCELSYNGKCIQCEQEYILIGEKNNFQICKSINTEDLKNCKLINTINGLCDECEEGYNLNKGDLKCGEVENCYKTNYGICSSCIDGYCLNKKTNKCIKNDEFFINCKETLDGEKCDSCLSSFF